MTNLFDALLMCKIKLNSDNVNEIKEERITNLVYTGSVTSYAYV